MIAKSAFVAWLLLGALVSSHEVADLFPVPDEPQWRQFEVFVQGASEPGHAYGTWGLVDIFNDRLVLGDTVCRLPQRLYTTEEGRQYRVRLILERDGDTWRPHNGMVDDVRFPCV